MDPNLPVVVESDEAPPPLEPRQNISVAFLPLALITFTVLAIIAAAWTFLAALGT